MRPRGHFTVQVTSPTAGQHQKGSRPGPRCQDSTDAKIFPSKGLFKVWGPLGNPVPLHGSPATSLACLTWSWQGPSPLMSGIPHPACSAEPPLSVAHMASWLPTRCWCAPALTSSPSCRSHWAHSSRHKGRWQSELPMAPCWMNPPCQGETPPAGLRKTHPKACHQHPWQTSTGLSSNPQESHCQLHGSGREEVSPPAQRTWETMAHLYLRANQQAAFWLCRVLGVKENGNLLTDLARTGFREQMSSVPPSCLKGKPSHSWPHLGADLAWACLTKVVVNVPGQRQEHSAAGVGGVAAGPPI